MSNLATTVANKAARDRLRGHIRGLMDSAGVSLAELAAASNTRLPTLKRVMSGKNGIRTENVHRLLTLTPETVRPVPDLAGGAMWRARGLIAMGHSPARIASAAGMDETAVEYLVKGSVSGIDTSTAAAIHDVYGAWWDKTPPLTGIGAIDAADKATARAKRQHWPTPMGLDDPDPFRGSLGMDAANYVPAEGWRPAIGTGTAADITPRKETGMTEHTDPITAQRIAGRQEASEVFAAAMSHGRTPGQIAGQAEEASGGLLAAAGTEEERAFAAAFADEARSISIENYREAERHGEDLTEAREHQAPEPITMPDWTMPHPDPNLALRGWETGPDGITQREDGRMVTAVPETERAGLADVMGHLRAEVEEVGLEDPDSNPDLDYEDAEAV